MLKGEYGLLPTEIQSENGMVTKKFSILFLFLVLSVFSANSFGVNWTGGGADNLWSTGANWNGGSVPGAGDAAVINVVTNPPLISSSVGATCISLALSNVADLTMTGGTLACGTGYVSFCESIVSIATTFTMSGGTVTSAGTIYFGRRAASPSSTFTMNMSGGSFINTNADKSAFSGDGANVYATFNISGTALINIGYGGQGFVFGDDTPSYVNQTGGRYSLV